VVWRISAFVEAVLRAVDASGAAIQDVGEIRVVVTSLWPRSSCTVRILQD
jgi:hypothetical protein